MEAYEGPESYIFISYAHRDAQKVWPILDALNDRGYRIWFDDGIDAGSEWPAYIEDHLNRCAAVISFITPKAVASANCRKEITYALSRGKPFVYVMLEETELAQGMSLQLADQYCVKRGSMPEEKFLQKLCSSDALGPCRRDGETPAALPVRQETRPAAKKPPYWLFALLAAALVAAAVLFLKPGTKEAAVTPAAVSEEEQRWLEAKALYDAGDYHAAYAAFLALGGYRDTDAWLLSDPEMSAAAAAYRSYRVQFKTAATVQFGRYEQDGDLADGPEPIEWIVLRDSGNDVLLLSAKILDSRAYNELDPFAVEDAAKALIPAGEDPGVFMGTEAWDELYLAVLRELSSTTWESCTLRAWLNGEFLESAFTAKKRQNILPTALTPYKADPERATEDRVFLLTVDVIRRYFDLGLSCGVAEAAKETLTPYGSGGSDGTYAYWVCGPSAVGPYCANAGSDSGGFLVEGFSDSSSNLAVTDEGVGVRPCITLDVSAANGMW